LGNTTKLRKALSEEKSYFKATRG